MRKSIIRNLWGQNLMIFGAAFFKYASTVADNISPFVGSFSRVFINLLVPLCLFYMMPGRDKRKLLGNDKKTLLIWGVLGALTISFFFQSLVQVGVGIASFLLTTSGAIMVFLSPLVSNKVPSLQQLIASIMCIFGASCLSPAPIGANFSFGVVFGLLAALSAAGAYLIVGDKMTEESPLALMFYWSALGIIIHVVQMPFLNISYDFSSEIWIHLFVAAFLSSVGQYWVNMSYQCKGNWIIGLVSYIGCISGLLIDDLFLGINLVTNQYIGIMIILGANVILAIPSDLKFMQTMGKKLLNPVKKIFFL